MRKENINLYETIKKVFPEIIVKDLNEYERICPVCKGLGMVIEDNIYGIKNDTSEISKKKMFPYKHQALSFCHNCYNGVQKLCPYCGKPFKNQSQYRCDCEGYKKMDDEKRMQKWNKIIANAKQVNEKDVENMLYCKETNKFYLNMEDFFDDWCNYEKDNIIDKPERLWVTSKEKISINANNVIEDACNNLHDEAMENCDCESLQELLDNWCAKQIGTDTYYQCYNEYILIDWNKF